ncbi:MAG TPA: fatty acid desaturase [Kofleriaceae bacterium]|nr:fatty acid desaturase [Kofleriaceae bacterium]
MSIAVRRPDARRDIEIPTLALAAAIHAGWLALTWSWAALPAWLWLPAATWLLAWHNSLQHEAVHGHPTGRPALDAVIAGIPLGLWLPFPIYRTSHLAHHGTAFLTDPFDDPESYYVDRDRWTRMSRGQRAVLLAMQTVAGRLLLGPPVVVLRFAAAEARQLAQGDLGRLRIWAVHALGCAAVLTWVVGVCGIPAWVYLLGFVYPGLSLTLLRSFIEHRPAAEQVARSALVEAGPVLSLLYLNNNLHALHHAAPTIAWYQLPSIYRETRAALLRRNGGFRYAGYLEVLCRFALRPKDSPVAPSPASERTVPRPSSSTAAA